ncbi:MAG: hypothetical protein D6722_18640 [Bacteroidetes bacterium]|nr:MAG: hypothetical protein D6722_18640 [Bacteroidota bacterium]
MRPFIPPKSYFLSYSLCLAILLLTLGLLSAQAPLHGNGDITRETRLSGEVFHQLAVKTYCNVTVRCGHMPRVVVETDANIQDHLQVSVRGGLLSIDTDTWIEPSQIQVLVEVPFLHRLPNCGWGRVTVEDLEVETFTLAGKTGTFLLSGQVETLILKAGIGTIDAGALKARRVEIQQDGHGTSLVQADKLLTVSGSGGRIRYLGQPGLQSADGSAIDLGPYVPATSPAEPVEYVEVRVRNNRPAKKDFYIMGPPGRAFSYGFPMQPFATHKKVVPPGTEIYETNFLGLRGQRLLTIQAGEAGQTLDLYPQK